MWKRSKGVSDRNPQPKRFQKHTFGFPRRHVNFADDPIYDDGYKAYHQGTHNLAVTLLQAFGVDTDRFGDYDNLRADGGVQPGPLAL